MKLAAFHVLMRNAMEIQDDLAEDDERTDASFEGWLTQLNTIVHNNADAAFELADRVRLICETNPYSAGEYAQWAAAVTPEFQRLLEDVGLVGFWIIPTFESDHFVDRLDVGTPNGGAPRKLPDPFNLDTGKLVEEKVQKMAQFILGLLVEFGVLSECSETLPA